VAGAQQAPPSRPDAERFLCGPRSKGSAFSTRRGAHSLWPTIRRLRLLDPTRSAFFVARDQKAPPSRPDAERILCGPRSKGSAFSTRRGAHSLWPALRSSAFSTRRGAHSLWPAIRRLRLLDPTRALSPFSLEGRRVGDEGEAISSTPHLIWLGTSLATAGFYSLV